jgi:hypothetical protein
MSRGSWRDGRSRQVTDSVGIHCRTPRPRLTYRVTDSKPSPKGGWFVAVSVSLGGDATFQVGVEIGADELDADGQWSEFVLRRKVVAVTSTS